MASVPDKNLSEWIRKRKVDLTSEGYIDRIELWHAMDGDAGTPLETFRMEERPEDEDPDDLTQEIWNGAERDAETRPQGSHQRYVVQAWRGDNNKPDATLAFVIQGRAISALLGGGTEPPTSRGMLAQEMRQNDNLHGMVISLCKATAGDLALQLENERKQNTNLQQNAIKLLEIEQRLLDRQQERDLEREAAKRNAERIDMLITTATSFLPVVLAKFFSPPAGPGALPPNQAQVTGAKAVRDTAVGNLMGSLKPEQMQGIFQNLDPQQALALMEIYKSFREDHQQSHASVEENDNVQETH